MKDTLNTTDTDGTGRTTTGARGIPLGRRFGGSDGGVMDRARDGCEGANA